MIRSFENPLFSSPENPNLRNLSSKDYKKEAKRAQKEFINYVKEENKRLEKEEKEREKEELEKIKGNEIEEKLYDLMLKTIKSKRKGIVISEKDLKENNIKIENAIETLKERKLELGIMTEKEFKRWQELKKEFEEKGVLSTEDNNELEELEKLRVSVEKAKIKKEKITSEKVKERIETESFLIKMNLESLELEAKTGYKLFDKIKLKRIKTKENKEKILEDKEQSDWMIISYSAIKIEGKEKIQIHAVKDIDLDTFEIEEVSFDKDSINDYIEKEETGYQIDIFEVLEKMFKKYKIIFNSREYKKENLPEKIKKIIKRMKKIVEVSKQNQERSKKEELNKKTDENTQENPENPEK